jgi:hypothetical protein
MNQIGRPLINIEEQNIFPFVSIERDISTMDI